MSWGVTRQLNSPPPVPTRFLCSGLSSSLRRGPAVARAVGAAVALEVEAPGRVGAEGEGLERDLDLRDPAVGEDRRARLPEGVPALVEAAAVGAEQGVAARAGGGELEEVAGLAVAEGVEDEFDAVVFVEEGVPRHVLQHHAPGLGLVADGAQVEELLVAQQAHLGGRIARPPPLRPDLGERAEQRALAPDLGLEHAVDDRRHGCAHDLDAGPVGVVAAGGGDGRQDERNGGGEEHEPRILRACERLPVPSDEQQKCR